MRIMATLDYRQHARAKPLQALLYKAVKGSEPAVEGITRTFVVQQIIEERERGIRPGLRALVSSAASRLGTEGNGANWTYTRRHSTEVGFFSYIMAAQAKRHNIYEDCPDPKLVYLGGILHDIGKTLLPMSLIVKELGVKVLFLKLFEGERMNDIERRVLRDEHLSAGTRYVRLFGGNGDIKVILDMVGLHHVMYNGQNTVVPSYPSLLRGKDLPAQANIAKAADFISAVQPRHYREDSFIHTLQGALAYSLAVAGIELDPAAVACFIAGTHDIEMPAAMELANKFTHPDGQFGISDYTRIRTYVQEGIEHNPEFLDLVSKWDLRKVHSYELETVTLAREHGFPALHEVSTVSVIDKIGTA
jgi:hypothetical protein